MTKQEFLDVLRQGLCHLPKRELDERLGFYEEMIEDKIEEGFSEEDAVLSIGSVDEILAGMPSANNGKEYKSKKNTGERKKIKVVEIVLLAAGAPILLALLISAAAIVISLYAVMWALVISLWASFGAFLGTAVGCSAFVVGKMIEGNMALATVFIGAAVTLAGLGILTFIASKGLTGLTVKIPKAMIGYIKKRTKDKEAAK